MVSFAPRPLYYRGKSLRYPLDRRFGGPQSRSGRRGEQKVSFSSWMNFGVVKLHSSSHVFMDSWRQQSFDQRYIKTYNGETCIMRSSTICTHKVIIRKIMKCACRARKGVEVRMAFRILLVHLMGRSMPPVGGRRQDHRGKNKIKADIRTSRV
jgi:hypothetical protein